MLEWTSNPGGMGFGMKDYEHYRDKGYSDDDIRSFLEKNKKYFGQYGANVGQRVREKFGLSDDYTNAVAEEPAAAIQAYAKGAYDRYRSDLDLERYKKTNEEQKDAIAKLTSLLQEKSNSFLDNLGGNAGGTGGTGDTPTNSNVPDQATVDKIKDLISSGKPLTDGSGNVDPEAILQEKLKELAASGIIPSANKTDPAIFTEFLNSQPAADQTSPWGDNEFGW